MAPDPRRAAVLATVAWLAAFAVAVGLVVAVASLRGGEAPPAFVANGDDLHPNTDAVERVGKSIDVRGTLPGGRATLLQLRIAPFQAADRTRVRIEAGPVPQGLDLALIWARRSDPQRLLEKRITLDERRVPQPLRMSANPDWRGEIAAVAVAVRGTAPSPWRVDRVTLDAPGVAGVAQDVFADWTTVRDWDGRSINVAFGGDETQTAWLPALAFAAAVAATLALALVARRRAVVPIAFLVLPFAIAWLVVDLRWGVELTRRAASTWNVFAGKSLDERHAAMDDADLYRVIASVRTRLPAGVDRVFVGSDFEYFALRAAYHLYPYNVLPVGWQNGAPMRKGDYVFLYQKAAVRFDATNGVLLWPDGSRTAVSAVYAKSGAGMFRVE